MDTQKLVGIHLATSSVRVAVYDLDGTLIDSGEVPIGDQSTVAWERALREAVPTLPETGICSVTSTSGTALLVDRYGEPVFPPQMYYESAPRHSESLRELDLGDQPVNWDTIVSPTGPIAKVLRLREQYPDQFDDVEWILSPTTWLLYRLNYGSTTPWRGVETDWTDAMKFGADVTTPVPTWFTPLFDAIELPHSLFPTIRPPGSYVGIADSELAERTGLRGIKLFQGVTDGSAFVLANGCYEPGEFSVTFGATSVVKYVSESITPHEALYHHRHPLDGYLLGASFESGNALRWFFDRVIDCTEQRGLELAKSVPAGEEYEMYPPGNRSPFFDPAVGTSILGLQYDTALSTDEVHGRLARGLTSGIVLAEWTYISLLEDHYDTTIDRVRIMNDGAPTEGDSYRWWNELRASAWDRPVVEMEPRTTLGPVIPATLITGTYSSAEDAMERLLRRRESFEPDPELATEFVSRRETYLDRWRTTAALASRR
jgi:xylulokinase